jgi:glycosyltransferase involved in cell wall biosynthesis
MKNNLISIIMNCYNGENYLKESIESVINQSYTNWEIIFWDNASTDSSPLIVNGFEDDRIKYYRGESNVDLGYARNLAISRATGNYISFLDVDDLWHSDFLEKMIVKITNSSSNIVIADTFHFNNSDGIIGRSFEAINITQLKLNKKEVIKSLLIKGCFVDIEAVLIKSELLTEIRFNAKLNYVEDYDFWLKIGMKTGFEIINEPLARWRIHDQQATTNLGNVIYSELIFLFYHYSRWLNYWEKMYILLKIIKYSIKFFLKMKKNRIKNDIKDYLRFFSKYEEK